MPLIYHKECDINRNSGRNGIRFVKNKMLDIAYTFACKWKFRIELHQI
jgi:hypothetical protein